MAKSRYSQTWTSILKYLKRELGTGITLLEISDDEIVEGLEEDVLALFSQYTPHRTWTWVTSSNLIPHQLAGQPRWLYDIPIKEGETIIDIFEAMPNITGEYLDELGNDAVDLSSSDNMINVVISNAYTDASRSLGVQNTWTFFPPKTIEFDKEITRAAIIYDIPHATPKTVRPDMYNTTFKPLCLGTVQRWLVAKRAKFENVATPFGQINLNWQKLETDSQTHIQDAMQKLELIPPDRLIEIA
jgi:hypothetical protein